MVALLSVLADASHSPRTVERMLSGLTPSCEGGVGLQHGLTRTGEVVVSPGVRKDADLVVLERH